MKRFSTPKVILRVLEKKVSQDLYSINHPRDIFRKRASFQRFRLIGLRPLTQPLGESLRQLLLLIQALRLQPGGLPKKGIIIMFKNEIAQLLQQRVGLSAEQAQEAAQAIIGLIESKIPPNLQGMVLPLLGGDASGAQASSGGLGSLLGSVEGMFGSKG
jgi:hypothetical protein